ncbi:MAG TPA: alpha/beta hydrolase [Sphingomicrobium sp.]
MKIRAIVAAFLIIGAPSPVFANQTERKITVAPNVVLRTVEMGNAAAAPIVFIPGWSAGADIWSGQIERFASKYRVIAFDPRSQGRSTKVTSGNTPEQRAADLHALLVAQHIKRPVLVAWSQAVQDVAAYVLKYGTRDISGVVLVDAAISDGSKGIAARPDQAAFQFSRFGSYLSDQEAYLRGMFGAIISKPQPPGVVDRAIATGMKTPPSVGMSMLVSDMFTLDRTAALGKMDCPVLIIAAASSFEADRQKAEAKAMRNARFVQIDDSSHAVFLDQPDRFAAELQSFLDTLPRS